MCSKRRLKAIMFAGFAVLFAALLAACDAECFRGPRPTDPAVSLQDAVGIAERWLAVRYPQSTFNLEWYEMDWEMGRWVWELDIRVRPGRVEYEFYICVETGDILRWRRELD